ncbi:MAG: hypothetical protein GY811_10740 [Myxococcales bacterium]|nr:hypothetical protein [Myxococcales bacterium]
MDSLQIIRLWAAAAWADDSLHPSEAAAIKRLIDVSDDLSATQRDTAISYLDSAPAIDVEEARSLPAEAREGVYRAARGIVMLDRELVEAEKLYLERLHGALGLDDAIIARLESE